VNKDWTLAGKFLLTAIAGMFLESLLSLPHSANFGSSLDGFVFTAVATDGTWSFTLILSMPSRSELPCRWFCTVILPEKCLILDVPLRYDVEIPAHFGLGELTSFLKGKRDD
jgi:hypothetical protein